MHDKYAYEKSQMALHDSRVHRFMAFGIAGMSVLADSLSAIKYARVRCIRDEQTGLITDFEITGSYPAFGNDDDRVDGIACEQVEKFYRELKKNPCYRNAEHTLSILTITSNVMYGKKTGATRMEEKRESRLRQGRTPWRAGRRTARWRRSTPSPSCAMISAGMAFPILFPSSPRRLEKRRASRCKTSSPCWMGISCKARTTSMSMCSTAKR